jgi:predicted secreted protein
MAANSGIDGKVVIAAATVAKITEWSIDIKHNVQDQTGFTETWESKLKGLLGASGTFKGLLDYADTNGQTALHTAMLGTITVTLKLYYSTTAYYSLTAFLTDLKSSNKVDGKVEVEYGFSVTGAVTMG